MSLSPSLIQGAERVVIRGGSFHIVAHSGTASDQDIQTFPRGFQSLIDSEHVSWGSLYNSNRRMNEANGTAVRNAAAWWDSILESRKSSGPDLDHTGVDDAIDAIFSWVNDFSAQSLMMWVHDSDRAKTSLIAQVVANLLADRGKLSATYFFDEHTDRNTVVPTLVHEFAIQHDSERNPDLMHEISRVIESKPVGVFNFTPRAQLDRLLVGPLIAVSKSYEADAQNQSQDNIILFHAFEDCDNEGDFQEVFLFDLMEALSVIKANTVFPQRLLLIGKSTDRLTELMGRLSSRLPIFPILQRPVQNQHWSKREQDLRQKTTELTKREDEVRRSSLEKEEKMQQMYRRNKEECERMKTQYLEKEKDLEGREKMAEDRENKLRAREESLEQKSKALKQQKETLLRSRQNKIQIRTSSGPAISIEDIPTSLISLPTSPDLQSPLQISPTQDPGSQEDARMISPASQVTKGDRVIILMGPLISQKSDFIDCLTRCANPWRFHPSTKTSNQFFDSLDDNLGKGRFWVKAVRTQRLSHSVLFVDFPSLGDDDLAAPKILKNIGAWLDQIHSNEITKIAGILYFHSLLEFEKRGPSYRNLRALGPICGDQAAKKVLFVFRERPPSPNLREETFFERYYGDLMKGFGARFAYFNDTPASGWRIVDRLLSPQNGDVSLLLQDELLFSRRSLHETYAARRLYGDLITRYTKKLRGLDSRASDSTSDQRHKIQAELERLQRLQPKKSIDRTEHPLLAKPVNFPDLFEFPEID